MSHDSEVRVYEADLEAALEMAGVATPFETLQAVASRLRIRGQREEDLRRYFTQEEYRRIFSLATSAHAS